MRRKYQIYDGTFNTLEIFTYRRVKEENKNEHFINPQCSYLITDALLRTSKTKIFHPFFFCVDTYMATISDMFELSPQVVPVGSAADV